MDEDWGHMTRSLLNLTLEIIHLLTGEDYEVVKKTPNKDMKSRRHKSLPKKSQTSIMSPLTSWIPVRSNKQRILEVTNEIVELLTEEVPVRCQDVAVYLTMEEREYLEEHYDLYKEAMEDEPPVMSPDGSGSTNSPERSPHPLFSQEDKELQQQDQLQVVASMNMEAEEDKDSEEEEATVTQQHWQSQKKGIPSRTGTDGRARNVSGEHLLPTQDCQEASGNDSRDSVRENPETATTDPQLHSAERSPEPSHPKEPPSDNLDQLIQSMAPRGKKLFSCPACGKKFTSYGGLHMHKRLHTGEKPFSCSVCGKSFTQKGILANHEKIHQGIRPFPCSLCGKCFAKKSDVVRHMTVHTGEKPFPCDRCGKYFSQRSSLLNHLRLSVCEKPYPCFLCGKRFSQRSDLAKHQEIHRRKSVAGWSE